MLGRRERLAAVATKLRSFFDWLVTFTAVHVLFCFTPARIYLSMFSAVNAIEVMVWINEAAPLTVIVSAFES